MKRISVIFLICIFISTCTACTREDNTSSQSSIPSSSDASTASVSVSVTPSSNAFVAYKNVLQNTAEINNTDAKPEKTTIYLKQLLNDDNIQYRITYFTLLDMDGDNIPELIFQYTSDADDTIYDYVEVLSYHDGSVYGYDFYYKQFGALKTDGSFLWPSAGRNFGYSKIQFKSNSIEEVVLGYCEPDTDSKGNQIETYFINDKTVSKDTFSSFCNSQNDKEDVTWYKFTPQNIEKRL